jgi:DNA-binding response OmpR family regulator
LTPEKPGRLNDGTTAAGDFRCSLPLQEHSSVVLVADDDALFRKLITLLMRQDGHFVLSAANGHEGLEISRRYPGSIDLLITDMEMPRLNGTDLCTHLLEERPGIRVLVLSGGGMSEIISQNVRLPFLPKPFDPKTLKAKVRAILDASDEPAAQSFAAGMA